MASNEEIIRKLIALVESRSRRLYSHPQLREAPNMNEFRLLTLVTLLGAVGSIQMETASAQSAATTPEPPVETKPDAEAPRRIGGGPWGDPDVLEAAAAVNMTPEQLAEFRVAVGSFVDDLMRETLRLVKRQEPDIPRKLKRKRRKLAGKMDETMSQVLDEDQYPRYEEYRDLLMAKLAQMGSGGGRRR
ncbi:MAG: hypothetical protein O7F71_08175 [Gammaproteobacteria bacterium]|nr:hypothetical protein [Gammaproteobacteria bacterium]